MKKRALIIGNGALYGAYSAGVTFVLCRELGPDYFDSVYASSVGVFEGTFYVANQPDTIEKTWRNKVDGDKLFSITKPFFGKKILDLDYLIGIFQGNVSHLDLKKVFNSKVNLRYFVVEEDTRKGYWKKPNKKDIFDLMQAASAVPIVYGEHKIKNKSYSDLSFVYGMDELIETIDLEQYDKVIIVYNHPKEKKTERFFQRLSFDIFSLIQKKEKQRSALEKSFSKSKVKVIRPQRKVPLLFSFDTDKERIGKTIDLGIKDAKRFLEEYNKSSE